MLKSGSKYIIILKSLKKKNNNPWMQEDGNVPKSSKNKTMG